MAQDDDASSYAEQRLEDAGRINADATPAQRAHNRHQRKNAALKAVRAENEALKAKLEPPRDERGLARFDVLRRRQNEAQAFLYAFDLLELDGTDLRREPIETRKATLASVLRKAVPACV
jgi:hypothetical protein